MEDATTKHSGSRTVSRVKAAHHPRSPGAVDVRAIPAQPRRRSSCTVGRPSILPPPVRAAVPRLAPFLLRSKCCLPGIEQDRRRRQTTVMTDTRPTHDAAYKHLFTQPRMVQDLLKGFAARDWSGTLNLET